MWRTFELVFPILFFFWWHLFVKWSLMP
jgi:hypothetical protein